MTANEMAAPPGSHRALLSGVVPYLVTPIGTDGRPDEGPAREMTARALAAGVHGLVPLGSSGEYPYVGDHDRSVVLRAVVKEAGGRTPVVPGVGGFSAKQAVAQAKAAVDDGADGVLCIILGFGPLTDDEILRYVDAVVASVDVPVGLYHNPDLCGVRFSAAVAEAVLGDRGVVFIKDASGSLANVARWAQLAQPGTAVFSSTSVSPAAAMLFGAAGWMSGPASAFPAESVRLFELCRQGRWDDAVMVERALDPALELFRRLGPTRGAKALVAAVGIPVGAPIPPLAPFSSEEVRFSQACVEEVRARVSALPNSARS